MKKSAALCVLSLLLVATASGVDRSAKLYGQSEAGSMSETEIVFFHSPTCPHCEKVEEFLDQLNESSYELEKYRASSNTELFSEYVKNYSVPPRYAGSVPAVFIGQDYAIGSRNSIQLIREKTDGESMPDRDTRRETHGDSGKNMGEGQSISELGLAGLMGLAAADSINPCAIAVLLILMGSIMSGNLERKGRALRSGAAFVAGIFVSYFSMGLLLVLGIRKVQSITATGIESVYLLFGIFALLVGLLNLKDGLKHGPGGFVMEVPYSWRPKMKYYLKKITGPAGAFMTSLLVSLFLLPCTSGPYFVAGGILASRPISESIPLLLIYNMVFIAPMLLILAGIRLGVTRVDEIKKWREENIEELHIAAGVIILLLGIYLLVKSQML